MRKSFKFRLYTNRTQYQTLEQFLNSAKFLYNCALEHKIICWKQWKKFVSYYEQAKSIPEIRTFQEGIAKLNSSVCQDILQRLDKAFTAFFRRVKKGNKPGYPRFKSKDRFNSITFVYGDGTKLKKGKLYIQNIGTIRIKLHREIKGVIKTVTIKRETNKFYAIFSCDEVPIKPLPITKKNIGIDVGCENFATLSDETVIENPRILKQSEMQLKELQSEYSKHKSKHSLRKLQRLHHKVKNQRLDFLHKTSRTIINNYDRIFVEDLKIQQMIHNTYNGLNKSIFDVAWSQFFNFLNYKAEEAGNREFVKVNPRGTSQLCSQCGTLVPKELGDRVHHCCSCGFVTSRDHNAALNILKLGQSLVRKRTEASDIC